MSKKMLIDATHAEETRVVVVDGNKVEEFDFESVNKRQLAGNIYLAKVTRVEPSLQAAFVDYGGNRHGFLAFSEIHPDYYQIPVADREALLAEEAAYAEAQAEEEESRDKPKPKRRSRRKPVAEAAANLDQMISEKPEDQEIKAMDVVELDNGDDVLDPIVGFNSDAAKPADDNTSAKPADDQSYGDDETDDDDNSDDDGDSDSDNTDSDIESVGQDDPQEEARPARKPRPRRYKIQEVIKVRQILLIQVVKEERGNKGAALTTYLSLAGRYCVLMPNTARGGGISRKITNAADRKKLKEIAGDIEVPKGAGLIIRTAGANRTKSEIKRDYDYLLRQWEQIRDLTLKSIAPSPIYEEGSLIKRSIRDLYSKEIDEILIEGEAGYRMAKDYMKMLMPSHAKNVKHYTDPLPLYARFQVESYLSGMFNPTVQLRSGGYIVIGVTEALVAIDVNSGRATKEGSIEDTAVKTNLEAADEVARQLRLRDLAGLIVIDFIDMEDRRNNASVEKRIKERLKTDRARIQIGRISGFGLMEMSRQRLRPGMIEATTAPCPHCHGTGLTRSDDNLSLAILRELEEEGVRQRSREVLITAPVAIANYMLNQKRDHVAMIEARYGLSIRIEASPTLISPDYTMERFKTATRMVPEPSVGVVSIETSLLDKSGAAVDEVDDDDDDTDEIGTQTSENGDDGTPKKKRRRRRRRGGRGKSGNENGNQQNGAEGNDADGADADADTETTDDKEATRPAEVAVEAGESAEKPAARKRTTARKAAKTKKAEEPQTAAKEAEADTATEGSEAPEKPKPKRASRSRKKPTDAPAPEAEVANVETTAAEPVKAEPVIAEPRAEPSKPEVKPETQPAPAPVSNPEPAMAEAEPAAEKSADKPKRRGWWSRG
ncbi:MAG: Rne/Rng family ribonuclease [Rhodobacteraceae bacterium]|nr:Rne/Rng family ribonuclease [Paracoccaceae bacterium]